ncbi:3D domain-containing protein [Brevibacillus panacihumi]|uniref:3D domain-containing protein n=1 Tax=Brevibacillus panacihumi TaxID=497735 RepID=UPI003D0477A2
MIVAFSVAMSVPLAETYEVTAYTANAESTGKAPGHPAFGITASGARVREGVTAACPPELPFGTRVHIEGVGERVCTDRGGAIKGRRLDVYIADRSEALRFGRRKLSVTICAKSELARLIR